MNAISSKEFVTNIDKYFEIAKKNEQIFVQNDNVIFAVTRVEIPEKKSLEPNDDFFDLTADMKSILDERIKENEKNYLTAEESIYQLNQKYGL